MKNFLALIIASFILSSVHAQDRHQFTELLDQISTQWKQDSTTCKGYRFSVRKRLLETKIDSVGKTFLLSKLGNPYRIQKFYNGNTDKNYVSYIYYVFKDECPKIYGEALAIQFIFDEFERTLVDIAEILYCGY